MTIKLKGMAALLEQLRDLKDSELAGKTLARASRKAFEPVLETAKRLAPRDTGELADSLLLTSRRVDNGAQVGIRIGKGKGTKQAALAAAAFGEAQGKGLPAARRWHFAEFGTSSQPAKPFLRPALDTNVSNVTERLKVSIAAGIARVAKKRGGK